MATKTDARQSITSLAIGDLPVSPSRSGPSSSLIGMIRLLDTEERAFLSCQNIRDKGSLLIAEELAKNCKLKELLLGGNDITDVGAAAIANALTTNQNLKVLVLGDNRITDSGAEAFAKALKINRKLKELSLSCNKITDRGAIALSTACSNLSLLSLHGNIAISVTGGLALLDAFNASPAIRDIDLRGTNIPPETLMMLAKVSASRRPAQSSSTGVLMIPGNVVQFSANASAQSYIENVRKEISTLQRLKHERTEAFERRSAEAEAKALEEIAVLAKQNAELQREVDAISNKLNALTSDLSAAMRRAAALAPEPRPDSPLSSSPPTSTTPASITPRKSMVLKEKEREKEKDKDAAGSKAHEKPTVRRWLKWLLSPWERDVIVATRFDDLPRSLRSQLKNIPSELLQARWPLVCSILAFTDHVLIVASADEANQRRDAKEESVDLQWMENASRTFVASGDPREVFKKLTPLGSGSAGKVFSTQLDKKTVAIKQVAVKCMRDKERVLREMSVLRQLHRYQAHPNILQVHNVYETEGEMWVVMEHIDGSTLETLTTGHAIEPEQLAYAMKEVLTALKYMHSLGYVHGDVKSSNIMMTAEGEVKLIDFNLAFNERAEASKRGIAGTPSFIAPEIILGQTYSSPIDIYAFGMTAVEAVLGETWHATRPALAMWKAATEEGIPTMSRRTKPSLVSFITRCLIRAPEKRPTAAELLTDPFIGEAPSNAELKPTLQALFVTSYLQKWQ